MNQLIFDLKLSVEATSLYLLVEALADGGSPLDRQTALKFWNSPEPQLDLAFTELVARRVLGAEADGSWLVRPVSEWLRYS